MDEEAQKRRRDDSAEKKPRDDAAVKKGRDDDAEKKRRDEEAEKKSSDDDAEKKGEEDDAEKQKLREDAEGAEAKLKAAEEEKASLEMQLKEVREKVKAMAMNTGEGKGESSSGQRVEVSIVCPVCQQGHNLTNRKPVVLRWGHKCCRPCAALLGLCPKCMQDASWSVSGSVTVYREVGDRMEAMAREIPILRDVELDEDEVIGTCATCRVVAGKDGRGRDVVVKRSVAPLKKRHKTFVGV